MDVSILIPIISGVITLIASLWLTTLKNKTELRKIQTQQEQNYTKSLFDKRIEVYPKLYSMFSDYEKLIRDNKQSIESLHTLKDDVDLWNTQFGIFFTDSTTNISFRFRKYLNLLLTNDSGSNISIDDWNLVQKILLTFEKSLRTEIGIYHTKAAGESEEVKNIYIKIEDAINNIKLRATREL